VGLDELAGHEGHIRRVPLMPEQVLLREDVRELFHPFSSAGSIGSIAPWRMVSTWTSLLRSSIL
jgi:hypothetical protein